MRITRRAAIGPGARAEARGLDRYAFFFGAAALLVVVGTVHGIVRSATGGPALAVRTPAVGASAPLEVCGLALDAGADHEGFALDGSGWRAVRHAAVPGACAPAPVVEVWIRLPSSFRRAADGTPSGAVYRANLALVEAALTHGPSREGAWAREVGPIEEELAGHDLDADGRVQGLVTQVRNLPARYVGAAAGDALEPRAFPAGVELLRVARGGSACAESPGGRAALLVHHATKLAPSPSRPKPPATTTSAWQVRSEAGSPPDAWQFRAYREAGGRLEPLAHAEQRACAACHLASRLAVDGALAFPRKLPGAAGWWREDRTLALQARLDAR